MRVVRVAGVLVSVKDKFIILQRSVSDYLGGWWGLPAGGIHEGETPVNAAIRELSEETGIVVLAEKLTFVKEYYWKRTNNLALKFFLFKTELPEQLPVTLCEDHSAFKWVSSKECAITPKLLEGLDEILWDVFNTRVTMNQKL